MQPERDSFDDDARAGQADETARHADNSDCTDRSPERLESPVVAAADPQVEAARAAMATSPVTYHKRGKGVGKPKSLLFLSGVVLAVMAVGVYVIVWADNLRRKNERIELQALEERYVMSLWQQQYKAIRFPKNPEVEPPGRVFEPLNPTEKTRYETLLRLYGHQFKPNNLEQAVIDETQSLMKDRQRATGRPATSTIPATGTSIPATRP